MDLMQGAPDMLILKAVSLGPMHGYGVLLPNSADSAGRKATLRMEFRFRLRRAKVMHTSNSGPKGAGLRLPRSPPGTVHR